MIWVVRGALLVLLSFANLNLIWSPDVLPNTLFAWTIVRSGNVDYDEFASVDPTDERPDRIDRNAYFFRGCAKVDPRIQVYTTTFVEADFAHGMALAFLLAGATALLGSVYVLALRRSTR